MKLSHVSISFFRVPLKLSSEPPPPPNPLSLLVFVFILFMCEPTLGNRENTNAYLSSESDVER